MTETATTPQKIVANRRNAQASTGPKTPAGKSVSARNAVRHGILARLKVLPEVERSEDWEDHFNTVVDDIAPVGPLETALAERVALHLWRLARVARYEREVTALGLETVHERDDNGSRLWAAPEDMRRCADRRIQEAHTEQVLVAGLLELPDDELVDTALATSLLRAFADAGGVDFDNSNMLLPNYPDGAALHDVAWTAGLLRGCLAAVAEHAGVDPEIVLASRTEAYEQRLLKAQDERVSVDLRAERLRRRRLLPDQAELTKLTRYESHLERSLFRTLHELQRLQASRTGGAPAPVAVDVSVDTGAAA